MVLFDLRELNDTVFARGVFTPINRESILLAAHLPGDSDCQVFVHGLLHALAEGQRIDLFSGMAISIVPAGVHAPATFDLPTMLQHRDHWNAQANLPGPAYAPGDQFCVLTDAGIQRFSVSAGRRQRFRQDLARQLHTRPEALSIKPTTPRVEDHLIEGFISSGTLVATEQLATIPCPPARRRENRIILVLDCRRLLQGFKWLLLMEGTILVRTVVDLFLAACPDRYTVSVTGAPVRNRAGGSVFIVESGCMLTVAFLADRLRDDCQDGLPGEDPDGDGQTQRGSRQRALDLDTHLTDRSRSPRDGGRGFTGSGAVPVDSSDPELGPTALTCPELPWRSVTSVTPSAGVSAERPLASPTNEDAASLDLRRHPTDVPDRPPWDPVPLTFGILVPDFPVETVMVELWLPVSITAAVDAVRLARSPAAARHFPVLQPVRIQPDARWGLLLALPDWSGDRVTVCVDAFLQQDRLFAVSVPLAAGGAFLHNSLTLDLEEPWDIYVDGTGPFISLEVAAIETGTCVQVVARGSHPPDVVYLEDMLQSHLLWAAPPAFPAPAPCDRFYLVTADGPRVFQLHGGDAAGQRADIAALIRCHPRELLLTPGLPMPSNVSFRGLRCRTVVSALSIGGLALAHRPIAAILDARRILHGWIPVLTIDGWLDANPALSALLPGLPAGYRIVFAGVPSDVRWINVAAGEILVVVGYLDTRPSDGRADARQPRADDNEPDPEEGHDDGSNHQDSDVGLGGSSSTTADARTGHSSRLDAVAGRETGWHHRLVTKWSAEQPLAEPLRQHRAITNFGVHCKRPLFLDCGDGAILGVVAGCLSILSGLLLCSIYAGPVCWLWALGLFLLCHRRTRIPHACIIWVTLLLLVCHLPIPAMAVQLSGTYRPADSSRQMAASAACAGLVSGALHRAVPTPCRARRDLAPQPDRDIMWTATDFDDAPSGGPLHDTSELSDCCIMSESWVKTVADGPTLLDLAIADPASRAFYLACTLLETLVEHFKVSRPPAPSDIHRGPTCYPLRLQDYLPTERVYDIRPVSLHVGCTYDDVAAVTRVGMWQLQPLPKGVDPAIDQWMLRHSCPHEADGQGAYHHVDVYTDGSFDGEFSSWAFHAVASAGVKTQLLGWFGGGVQLDSSSLEYVGAPSHSALSGELSALFWCIGWTMQLPPAVTITVHSDCATAIGLSAGHMGRYTGKGIADLCRAGFQALVAIGGPNRIAIRHVRSHVGHLANEVADRLAKLACRDSRALPAVPAVALQRVVRDGWLPWLWLYIEATRNPRCWPTLLGGSLLDPGERPLHVPSAAECASMLGLPNRDRSVATGEEVTVQALFLTVNVQSLQPPVRDTQQHDGFQGRAKFLRNQLEDLAVTVAALQETRSRANEMIRSGTHIRFCSARDVQGAHGIELWFSRQRPFVHHRSAPVFFQTEDFLAVHWDSRVLAVRFVRASLRILFVSVHAPTSADPARATWWHSLFELLARLRQECQLVLLGDFNLHLDRSYGDHVGDLTWPTDTAVPPSFWKILRSFGLWLPSTFSCCHVGSSFTWRAPGGTTTSRLDYIAIPQHWSVPSSGSWVVPELDWGQAHTDHFALAMHVQAPIRHSALKFPRQPRLNTQQMRTTEGRALTAQICATVPLLPWDLDVHRHAAAIEQHLGGLLQVAFPAPRAKPQKDYLSAATWQSESVVAETDPYWFHARC